MPSWTGGRAGREPEPLDVRRDGAGADAARQGRGRFEITLVNGGSIGHSIDFHAGALAPDQPMRTIEPGESLDSGSRRPAPGSGCTTARRCRCRRTSPTACSARSSSTHPACPRWTAATCSCSPSSTSGRSAGPSTWTRCTPKSRTGRVQRLVDQYEHQPLAARVGERVRVWVLDAGPNRAAAFHIVGGQFDTVYAEGDYRCGRIRARAAPRSCPRRVPGRVRGAGVPGGRTLPVRHSFDGRRRARCIRNLPRRRVSLTRIVAAATRGARRIPTRAAGSSR